MRSIMMRSRVVGIGSAVACAVVALTALIALAQAPARPQPSTPSRPYVPFDPTAPAIREENELRKGAEGLQSGANPFPEFVKKIGPGLYEIGTVVLDMNAKQAKVPGRVNMNRGIIEYLAVVDGRGKLHESILALNVQPSMLQLALILMGLEAGEWAPPEPGARISAPTFVKMGDPLALFVEWVKDGKTERMPADTLIFNRETQQSLKGNRWNFTGSFFSARGFAADVTGSVIATFFDYRAVLNVSQQVGNPYRGQNQGYEINAGAVPPLDTPIRLVFEPAPR
jgi:hypothetical protein